MKYEILSAYRQYLHENIKNKNTADRYYFAVNKLLAEYQFDDLSEISREVLEAGLAKCSGKNDFSAAKNGLLHLKRYDHRINLPENEFF